MGVVYAATDPELGRKVALKLVSPEHSTPERRANAAALLMREAKALAMLSHPNVVSVYEVGTHGGQVYLAMDLVEGATLRGWLDEKSRSWREVLERFVAAGRGLAAAHGAGIVHRDFKPDNVLIARDGQVRVGDFGLARVSNAPSLPEGTPEAVAAALRPAPEVVTRTGSLLGTPAYMAPEQWAGETADARSDQYAFCVALLEALTGERPTANPALLAKATPSDPQPRPATVRLGPGVGRFPGWLKRAALRGLETKPELRYPSMDALLARLTAPRLRARTAAFVALLLAACVAAYFQWHERRSQLCSGAREELTGIWDAGRREAVARAFEATGKPYAQGAFRAAAARLDAFADAWARMNLESCMATRLRGTQSDEQLGLRAECLNRQLLSLKAVTGVFASPDDEVVQDVSQVLRALDGLEACADLSRLSARQPLPADAEQRLTLTRLQEALAEIRALTEAGRFATARQKLDTIEEPLLASTHAPTRADAALLEGRVLLGLNEFAAAERPLEAAVEQAERGGDDFLRAEALVLLMERARRLEQSVECERWARFAAALLDRLGPGRALPIEAQFHLQLGAYHAYQFRLAEAMQHEQKALALFERAFGPDSSWVGGAAAYVAGILDDDGRYSEALELLKRARRIIAQGSGPKSPLVAMVGVNHGQVQLNLGALDAAVAEHRDSLARAEEAMGREDYRAAQARMLLGRALVLSGRADEGLPLIEETLPIVERVHGRNSVFTADALQARAEGQEKLGRRGEALRGYREVVEIRRGLGPGRDSELAQALAQEGTLTLRQGEQAQALAELEEAYALAVRSLRTDHPIVAAISVRLAEAQMASGQLDEALTRTQAALKAQEATYGAEGLWLISTLGTLARAHAGKGELGQARAALERGERLFARWKGPDYLAEELSEARARVRQAGL
jgi:hypothetical protein